MTTGKSAIDPKLDHIADRLRTEYGELGAQAAEQLGIWLSGSIPFAHPEVMATLLSDEWVDLLFDSFWRLLPFGTGGRRGPVGYGPNRINPSVVAMTVQGHCDYLKRLGGTRPAVVVANDVRVFQDISGVYRALANNPLIGTSSISLARLACEIYAGNGITAYSPAVSSADAVMTTPMLSFAIRQLGARGGVNLSASHNPPDDNGIKVYDQTGAQPIPPHDQRLADLMGAVTAISRVPFEDGVRDGLIRQVPAEIEEEYARTYLTLCADAGQPRTDVPIGYTPLCGAGLTTVGVVLERLGYPLVVPPDQGPNGLFPVIPFRAPNPEVAEATKPAQAYAGAHGSTIVLSSDPDADRLGLDVVHDGRWYHCDGNQISAILTYFLMLDPKGPRRTGLVIETLVTTRLVRAIARKAGSKLVVDDLLVGFKYIADVLQSLTEKGEFAGLRGRPEDLVIAAEESHGILLTPRIRDKDATGAAVYLAALHQRLAGEGRTILDYYTAILEEFGPFDCVNRSIMLKGANGIERRDRMMSSLRSSPPARLAGFPVTDVLDHWDTARYGAFVSDTDQASRNLIEFDCGTFRIVVRPSGTEPKAKLYCELVAAGDRPPERGMALLNATRARADGLARKAYGDLLALVGLTLGESGLLLPDIVDIDLKIEFDQHTLPGFAERLERGEFTSVDAALAWLRQAIARMTPGTDPLPAVRSAVALASRGWSAKANPAVLDGVRTWAAAR